MFNLIRSLPYLGVAALIAGAGHWFIVSQKNATIDDLIYKVEELQQENIAYQTTDQVQKQTIDNLGRTLEEQQAAINQLSSRTRTLQEERDEYLSIFRRHDLTKLSRAKPGLIEPRINSGTKEVFETVEKDTQKIEDPNSYNNFVYDDIP